MHKIATELGCKRLVKTFRFGAANNAFAILSGKALDDNLDEKTIAVLDGDVYKTDEDKMEQIQRIITGHQMEDKWSSVLHAVRQYNLPDGENPEQFIRDAILSLPEDILPEDHEIRLVLERVEIADDTHQYLSNAIYQLDMEYSVGLDHIIDFFSKTEQWSSFIYPICEWIEAKLKENL